MQNLNISFAQERNANTHRLAIEAGGAVETGRPGPHHARAGRGGKNEIPDVFICRLLLNLCEVWLGGLRPPLMADWPQINDTGEVPF